ncbi:BTAD domain-containing putative transcriptional regulator [Nonomuraea endophytica]|uniref:DNA-binding NarL/FixJ family response regulator n=1 Tax=Nonomuraea endophytica TaxID=714136 RepID=A0A7W8AFK6_9ACTN|nr:BTAD domain-containing putative transcriptional regulator [Nonomuraea endophytica]MBB5084200.1 DNA-binding NarL/FixJ family response regulator [Nonomuraea endophytica]
MSKSIYPCEVPTSTRLSFQILGPFQAHRDGAALDLGGLRQLAVLARLLVARGRAVPASLLVDEIWPGRPPAQPLASIQGYVSRLRRALEPDRPPRQEATVLVNAPPGYALRADAEQVDAWRFESEVRRACDEPRQVWTYMEAALALWRGPALAELANLPWAATEAARLEELRLVAVERHADAGIRLGMAAALVPDLEAHACAHPLREEAWRLLASSLYSSGRLGDALGALRRARAFWREELGLDLSAELRALEADFLAQRPAGRPWLPEQRRAPERPAPRVLVADDQALVRAGLRVVLDAEPDVRFAGEAADGEEAVAAVRALRPDVVLLDIQMPRLDGLASARRILAGPRPPKVIMLTTFGSDENLYAALRAGVSGFILKTSPPEQLVAAVRAAAAGDALIDPAVTTRLIAAFASHPTTDSASFASFAGAPLEPAGPVGGLDGLSPGQLTVLRLVARGLSDRQIGQVMGFADAGALVGDLLSCLGLLDRAQLVVLAYESGLVTPGGR